MFFSSELEARRVPDEVLAAAYEGTSPERRSWIKTTLALVEAALPAQPSPSLFRTENTAAGFGYGRRRATAPWTVIMIAAGYASAIRLAAAIMAARVAGVDLILAACAGKPGEVPSAIFAALELTGVEQVFSLPEPSPLLRELKGRGRVLTFGTGPAPGAPAFPIWADRPPRMEEKNLPDEALIRWAHPDALPARGAPDVVYAGQDGEAALALGGGLEGCWLHADLSPRFFLNTRLELFTVKAEELP